MDEEWKDIYFIENGNVWDYRGLYQVSNYGRIKSVRRDKIMSPYTKDKNKKRFKIGLRKDNKYKKWYIHQLVAHMFCDGYYNGLEVDHIDSNSLNNYAYNLRWVTREENNNNPITIKKRKELYNSVKGINIKNGSIIIVDVLSDLKQYGFTQGDIQKISLCCNKKNEYKDIKYKNNNGIIINYHYEHDYADGIYKDYYWEFIN